MWVCCVCVWVCRCPAHAFVPTLQKHSAGRYNKIYTRMCTERNGTEPNWIIRRFQLLRLIHTYFVTPPPCPPLFLLLLLPLCVAVCEILCIAFSSIIKKAEKNEIKYKNRAPTTTRRRRHQYKIFVTFSNVPKGAGKVDQQRGEGAGRRMPGEAPGRRIA